MGQPPLEKLARTPMTVSSNPDRHLVDFLCAMNNCVVHMCAARYVTFWWRWYFYQRFLTQRPCTYATFCE